VAETPGGAMKPERWQKVKRICEEALECKADEREAFLAKACAGDDQLRKEVDSFLSGGDGKDGFIETPAIEMAAKKMAEDQPTANLAGEAFRCASSHFLDDFPGLLLPLRIKCL
jgi:hypothetical protein